MTLSRREAIELLGVSAVQLLTVGAVSAQPQSEIRPRMPLDEFVKNDKWVASLRRGVQEMKIRLPSDPLSWFFQAAMHAVSSDLLAAAAAQDPKVNDIFQKRYWNQCPHFGENSANFLPWHRGYTYYFEKILRIHTGDTGFSLPYWNYKDKGNRKFPREFGIEHMDANLNNNDPKNINPLYHKERDYYLCGYEHPFATGLPILELSDSAVDDSLSMDADVFFGETEREGLGGGIADEDPSTRGLLESYPHDQIHRAVGGIIGDKAGGMASPPTAAFDPIFPFHHSNIDRLWAEWSCKQGKKWGKLPSNYWFNERAWFFYDSDGTVVNEPRKSFFDYRAMGIKFKYEDPKCTPLALPDMARAPLENAIPAIKRIETLAQGPKAFTVLPGQRTVVSFGKETRQGIAKGINAQKNRGNATPRMVLRLHGVQLGTMHATGFDVHFTTKTTTELMRSDKSFIGSLAMFRHGAHGGHEHDSAAGDTMTESFDLSVAASAIENANHEGLSVVFVPYTLLTVPGKTTLFTEGSMPRVGGVEFLHIQ